MSTAEILPTFHKSNGYDGNKITTTVNCLETDLPNLYINGGIDTIRSFSPKATVKHRARVMAVAARQSLTRQTA